MEDNDLIVFRQQHIKLSKIAVVKSSGDGLERVLGEDVAESSVGNNFNVFWLLDHIHDSKD